jgi:branched-chain amino acid transport system substrate-binding protein
VGLRSQWRSFDRAGERRFETLTGPQKEVLVGVCWPFSVNNDQMAEGIRLAEEEINAGGLSGGIPIRLILRDDRFDSEEANTIATDFAEIRT